MGYSVGIGLTNDCNLNCAHCYRDTNNIAYLSLQDIQRICNAIPIESLGMGTGENGLHPQFSQIVEYLSTQNIKFSVASNGYTLMNINDGILTRFHDVEVSIDFPTASGQDNFRGIGNWELVLSAIKRCKDLNVEVSILTTLMSINYKFMDRMVDLARQYEVNLRVNAYQPVKSDKFRLSYEQFWEGYRRIFREGKVIACSEPVVRAVMGLGEINSPCGISSIRINPLGQVLPCVYWPTLDHQQLKIPTIQDLTQLGQDIFNCDLFLLARSQHKDMNLCPCHGGCASRRALQHEMNTHDEYCPWVRGDSIQLDWQPAPSKNLTRIGNCCTTIIQ